MKDFEKTKGFVENVNKFYFLVDELWENNVQPLEPYLSRLRDLRDTTRFMGGQLVSEVKEICPSLKDLQWYFDEWSRLIDQIILHRKFDKISSSEWAYKLQDDQAALTLCGIIRAMSDNYQDVISAKRMLAEEFDIETQESIELKEEMKNILKADKEDRPRYEPSFSNLIDPKYDKQEVLKRFHLLCDNQRPIDIGTTIAIAINDGILTREPRTKEFESEFSGVKYGSVYKHFHLYNTPGDENKENHDQTIYDNIEGKHFLPQ
jgi:hypothetical protein